MTFKELAQKIAEDFNRQIEEEGFENFKEMRSVYDWEPEDIRDEIEYMIKEYGEDDHFATLDDGSIIQFTGDWDEPTMSYREFKKLVFAEVK